MAKSDSFERFKILAKQVFTVPKTEVAKRLAAEKAARSKQRKAS